MEKIKRHYPRGVVSISIIEAFERFGFYATQGILVLYAVAACSNGGLGWSDASALQLTGIFSAVVYGTPIAGGWIADKFLGRKNGMTLGNILLFVGYLLMMKNTTEFLFIALTVIAIGTGFLKPTISAMVGEFYGEREDAERDAGFAIFYMSINIGGFIGPIISGYIGFKYGYGYAFGTSAVGMAFALINTFWCYNKTIKNVGLRSTKKERKLPKIPWTYFEKKRVWIYLAICVSNILWNIFYTLPYGLLNLWADQHLNRTVGGWAIPPAWYYSSYSVMIIIFSPIIAVIYKKLENKGKNFTLSYKLAIAYLLMGIGCIILMPFVMHIAANPLYKGNMGYFFIFYAFFAFSELLTIPVLLSAATKFAPANFSATLVSLNMLISWCIGGYLGGEVSALAVTISPTIIFIAMIIACFIFFFGHIFTNGVIEKNCSSNA